MFLENVRSPFSPAAWTAFDRQAKYYRLAPGGRKHPAAEESGLGPLFI
jgi:hypothetical protein